MKHLKNYILISLSISLITILFFPLLISFFYPIELEARESTLWLHILTIKEGINIYNPSVVAYANQAHGPIDPIFKLLIHKIFFFLEPWQVSRLNNLLLFLSIFTINYLILKKNHNSFFIIFISTTIYSLIFLFTKTFQGRADVTAMLLISWLCFFCSNQKIYDKNIKIILLAFLFSLIIMTNWRFLPLCLAIFFFPIFYVENFRDLLKNDKIILLINFIIFTLFPFIIILIFLFEFNLKSYFDYFITFFYFESHFSINHYLLGLKNLIRVEKFFLLIILLIIYLIKIIKEIKKSFLKKLLIITMAFLVFFTSFISYLYNYVGGGIYYFTPIIFFLWYLILFSYRKKKFVFNNNKNISVLIIFFSLIFIVMSIKNSIRSSKDLFNNYSNAVELNSYLSKISNNNKKVLSESLHFHKKKYLGEKIDIGDLISYRSSQVGGEYLKTYESHLQDLENGKYDFIIHNFTGSHLIKKLIKDKKYSIIKIFSNNYSNIGEVLILRKNFLSK
jgi:hypothetical protein